MGVVGASVEFITVELRQVRCAEGSATRSPTEKSEKRVLGMHSSQNQICNKTYYRYFYQYTFRYIEKTDTKCKSVKITTT